MYTAEGKRGFIHHYWSIFESKKEGYRLMCIKRSTLYYQPKDNLDKKIKETDIKNEIKNISYKHPYCGYRRTASLRRDKLIVNHKKVLKMMKQLGIQSRIKHKYITTADNKHNDNAFAESFFKTLKQEEVYLWEYEIFSDIAERIPYFIEDVYNKKRLYSSFGYRPPEEYERLLARNSSRECMVC